jgi:predicted house-cleaning noncanonical NTP pyrophosphatase (MazG superfamily)
MSSTSKDTGILYRKLVRDKIPEIIREVGKQPFTRKIQGDELKQAIAGKMLECVKRKPFALHSATN